MSSIRAKRYISALLPIIPALLFLCATILRTPDAVEGAAAGLELCARVIVPTLFPFFVLSSLLLSLGLPSFLGRFLEPVMLRLWGVSGEGAAAFVLGLSGGYPLGAKTVADIYARGGLCKDEAERLLAFCNNSGPSFIVGAAGAAAFESTGAGIAFFVIHAVAAAITGVVMSTGANKSSTEKPLRITRSGLGESFPKAIKDSIMSTLTVCGFIVFFSVIIGLLDSFGLFTSLAAGISMRTGAGLDFTRALLTGLLELGNGVGALNGLPLKPVNASLCAFILGWGGLSVHCQTWAYAAPAGLSIRLHSLGRLFNGLVSALLAFFAFSFFRLP